MPGEDDYISIFYIAGSLFVMLLVCFIFAYIYLHQRKVQLFKLELRDREIKKQRELFIAVNEGEENERKRISEELHDGIGAKLSGIKMSLEYLISQNESNTENLTLLKKIALGMDETIIELREISHNLSPSLMSSKGIETMLKELVAHFNHKKTCNYHLYIDPLNDVATHLHHVIYRITAELLTNIDKHANATTASVQLVTHDNTLQLLVEDNGNGFDTLKGRGIGITNIKNRVELYKGKINYDSSSRGTFIIIEFNLQA